MTAIIDLETDSENPNTAKLKYFGCMDPYTGDYVFYDFKKNIQIRDCIKKHKVILGYNFNGFDKKVLENYGIILKYHIILDIYEALAPKGADGFGEFNKNRLHDIDPTLSPKNYKLKTIISILGLDQEGNKGEIDYEIFKKDSWTEEETNEIIKYLKQDLIITKKLFDWYLNLFKPLEPFLSKKDVENLKHLSCSSAVLGYKVICNLAGLTEEYNSKELSQQLKKESGKIEGGHHIHPRWEKVRGKIICKDFVSHYPSIMIMYNLLPPAIAKAVSKLLFERIQAKINNDKPKAKALKIPNNAVYGCLGNPAFKHLYNPKAANDCTRIGRELLKRYAKTLDVAGFIPLYGFTDSVYIGIPGGNN